MAWLDARTRIAALLATVSITEPIEQTIERVHATPPANVEDLPCFIIYPPALKVERGSALRIKTYTVRLRLLVGDADMDQAADLVDAYREAVIDVFDTDTRLSNSQTRITGPSAEEAGSVQYPAGTGAWFTVVDCFLTVIIEEPKDFG